MMKHDEGGSVRQSVDSSKNNSNSNSIVEARDVIRRALNEGMLVFDANTKRVSLTEAGIRHLKSKYGRVFGTPVVSAVDAINEALKMAPPIFRVKPGSGGADFETLLGGIDISCEQPS
jgi:hypothetical protein